MLGVQRSTTYTNNNGEFVEVVEQYIDSDAYTQLQRIMAKYGERRDRAKTARQAKACVTWLNKQLRQWATFREET